MFAASGRFSAHEASLLVWEILGERKLVLSVADVAKVTGESERTIVRRINSGDIRSSQRWDRRGIRIPLSEVLRYCMV